MSTKKVRNWEDFVQMAGGLVHIAAALNVGQDAVWNWPRRKGIPIEHWPRLMSVYKLESQELLEINQGIWAKNGYQKNKRKY